MPIELTPGLDGGNAALKSDDEVKVPNRNDAAPDGGRSLRAVSLVPAMLLASAFLVAATYISVLVFQRQQSLGQVSRYNISWSAAQAVSELLRLESTIAEAAIPGSSADLDAVRLRFDIVKNRLGLLGAGEFGEFVRRDDERVSLLASLREGVLGIEDRLDGAAAPSVAIELLSILEPFNASLMKLASDANRTSGEAVSRDQSELIQLHWRFTALVCGLVLCGLGLMTVLVRHDRLLRRAHRALSVTLAELNMASVSKAVLDRALSNMSQGVVMLDPEGRLLFANQRFGQMFGLPPTSLAVGSPITSLLSPSADPRHSDVPGALLLRQLDAFAAGTAPVALLEEACGDAVISTRHDRLADGALLATYEDVSERKRIEAAIAHMARHDDLTGLANRVLFREQLATSLSELPLKQEVSILCLDLDHFKRVNDTLGHPVGDELLRAVARRTASVLREGDTLARLGGDEFAIVQSAPRQPEAAMATAGRVIDALQQPFEIQGHRINIGVSIGIASAPHDGMDADISLKEADLALYLAKGEGRSTFRVFSPDLDARAQLRHSLEADLRRAVEANEFCMFYQPLVRTDESRIIGFEALMRWQHPTRGILPPSEFIGLAEEVGLIDALGEIALFTACRDAARWPDHLDVAVNVSPLQFRHGDIVEITKRALAASGLRPDRLQLEITESVLLTDTEAVLSTLHRLRDRGMKVVMDDFGTGYSSLSYLRVFPFDKIKIDKSFVDGLGGCSESDAIVTAVMGLGRSLGMRTTVEGVETEGQLRWLERRGLVELQGYLFGRPVTAAETMEVISREMAKDTDATGFCSGETTRGSEARTPRATAEEVGSDFGDFGHYGPAPWLQHGPVALHVE